MFSLLDHTLAMNMTFRVTYTKSKYLQNFYHIALFKYKYYNPNISYLQSVVKD